MKKLWEYASFVFVLLGVSAMIYYNFYTRLTGTDSNVQGFKDPRDVTLVTMYINIGKFRKGDSGLHFSKDTYIGWMDIWSRINNTVFAFFDNNDVMEHFKQVRFRKPSAHKTHVYKISRAELSAFSHMESIQKIFDTPGYPRHYPNTVKAEYSCAMSAKLDAVENVLDMVTTKYVAWIDIGYFRHLNNPKLVPSNKTLTLAAPQGFPPDSVGVSLININFPSGVSNIEDISTHDMIYKNMVWVAGGFQMATVEVMRSYIRDYRRAVTDLIDLGLASTDQQVLMALYSGRLRTQPNVKVTTFECVDEKWFCSGYSCFNPPLRHDATYDKKHSISKKNTGTTTLTANTLMIYSCKGHVCNSRTEQIMRH